MSLCYLGDPKGMFIYEVNIRLLHMHCKGKKMDDIKVMFVFKHIDQKPFCNDKIH